MKLHKSLCSKALLAQVFWFFTFFLSITFVNAQDSNDVQIVFQNKMYRAWIVTQNEIEFKGSFVHFASDSGLYIREGSMIENTVNFIPFKDIKKVKFRKKGRIGHGALVGAGAMFGLGSAFAYAKDSESNFLTTGIALAPLGAIIGAIFGSGKTHVKIPKGEKVPESTLDILRQHSLIDETLTTGYLQQYYVVPIEMPVYKY